MLLLKDLLLAIGWHTRDVFSSALEQAQLFSCEEKTLTAKKKSHLPILLFTVTLVLSESSSRPLRHLLGTVADMAARGGIVRGGLPWDINGRFSSARRGWPPVSVRLGVNMQSWCSKRGRGRGHGRRLGWGEGGGWWWDGGDFWGGHSSEGPRGLIVSHAGCGSEFGCSSRGNGHRLNYFFRFFLCEIKKKMHTQKHTNHMHIPQNVFSVLLREAIRLVWSKRNEQHRSKLYQERCQQAHGKKWAMHLGKGMTQACTVSQNEIPWC